MKKTKRISREIAMQVIYQWEVQGLISADDNSSTEFINNIDLVNYLGHFLHNFYQKDKSNIEIPFVIELIRGTIGNLTKINNTIQQSSSKWRISRMDAIDRAILRVAAFEIMFGKKLVVNVIINEAIEIAKRYGGEQSAPFINGLLDTINCNKLKANEQ